MGNTLNLKNGSWIKDKNITYDFPENWDLKVFSVKDSPCLDLSQIKMIIDDPIGIQRIQVLAKSGMKVLLICDDLVRPTRTDIVVPVIIDSLLEAGIKDDDISVLIASGTHEVMNRAEIDLKFGKELAAKYKIFTHNYKKGNKYIGKTSQGTPVFINKLVLESDLVIGVGGIYPHDPAGFGGGAKLILGVCGISTILHFHRKRSGSRIGGNIHNNFRRDLNETARMAKLDFIVNMIINGDREVIDLVAGDVEKAYEAGIIRAGQLLSVPDPNLGNYDLIIADVYPIDSTFSFVPKGWWPVRSYEGDCQRLIIAAMPKGIGGHFLFPAKDAPKKSKLLLKYYEFRTFGAVYLINGTLKPMLKSALRKVRSALLHKKSKITGRGNEKIKKPVVDISEFILLHSAEGKSKSQLNSLHHRLFDDPQKCIQYISSITGNRSLKVALYKNSTLTFPVDEHGAAL
jgi:hypothetical protein